MSIEVAMQFGKPKQAAAAGTGPGMTLLWENDDPAAEFAAQTISLDLSDYDAVYCFFSSTSGNIVAQALGLIGDTVYAMWMTQATNLVHRQRWFKATSTGVQFGNATSRTQGQSSSATTNTQTIPQSIYGVKFG